MWEGRQSIPARRIKESCPAGREEIMRDHTWDSDSRGITSRNFFWTDNDSRWKFHDSECVFSRVEYIFFNSFFDVGSPWELRAWMVLGGISWLSPNSGLVISDFRELMFESDERETDARSRNLAFSC